MILEAMSEQSSPDDVIAQAEQEPFPEGILGVLGALQGECEREGREPGKRGRSGLT